MCILAFGLGQAKADPQLSLDNPTEFFTTVASNLLAEQLGVTGEFDDTTEILVLHNALALNLSPKQLEQIHWVISSMGLTRDWKIGFSATVPPPKNLY